MAKVDVHAELSKIASSGNAELVAILTGDNKVVERKLEEFAMCQVIIDYVGPLTSMTTPANYDTQTRAKKQLRIPMPNVTEKMLLKMIEYSAHFGHKKRPRTDFTTTEIDPWENTFFSALSWEELHDLLRQANYLENESMIHSASRFYARTVKDCKNLEGVDAKYGVEAKYGAKGAFSEEQRAEMRTRTDWVDPYLPPDTVCPPLQSAQPPTVAVDGNNNNANANTH